MRRRTTSCDHRHDRGAALLEFVLVLPILVLLVFGVVEFGRGYSARSTIVAAAREGARVAAVGTGDPVAAVRASAAHVNELAINVNVSPSPCVPGDPVTVTLTYDHDYTIPLYGEGTWTINDSAVMRCEG